MPKYLVRLPMRSFLTPSSPISRVTRGWANGTLSFSSHQAQYSS